MFENKKFATILQITGGNIFHSRIENIYDLMPCLVPFTYNYNKIVFEQEICYLSTYTPHI